MVPFLPSVRKLFKMKTISVSRMLLSMLLFYCNILLMVCAYFLCVIVATMRFLNRSSELEFGFGGGGFDWSVVSIVADEVEAAKDDERKDGEAGDGTSNIDSGELVSVRNGDASDAGNSKVGGTEAAVIEDN